MFSSACTMRFIARPVLFLAIFVVHSCSHYFNRLQRLYCQFTVYSGRHARGFNGAFLEGAWERIKLTALLAQSVKSLERKRCGRKHLRSATSRPGIILITRWYCGGVPA